MNTKSKNDSDRGGGQRAIWIQSASCDEGTEVDLRWGSVTVNYGGEVIRTIRDKEEFLLTQISEKILSGWGADSVDSAVAGSIPW
jgi:hypothetical protein